MISLGGKIYLLTDKIEVVSNSEAIAGAYKRLSPNAENIQIELFIIMIDSALGITIILIRTKNK